ncbi:MAG: hypothetical protein O2782_08030 [bacterium]|nr:hypothetical protein [bacterium]
MKLVLAAALVTALAFAGARFSFLHLSLSGVRGSLWMRNILLTGTEFVFVGLLLGSPFLGILDDMTLVGLAPILGMGLSWIGLLFGIQWQVHRWDGVVRSGLVPALVQASVVTVIIAVPFFFLLRWSLDLSHAWCLVGALTLGAAGSDTAQSALALVGRSARGESRALARLLRLVADLDGLVAVAVFGAVCWLPVLHGDTGSVGLWAALSVGLGVVMGLVVVALTSYQLAEEELLLVLLGTVFSGGGLALYLSLSPLFVNAVTGAVVANLAQKRVLTSLQSLLVRGDRSVYVLFLILAGAQWHPSGWGVLSLAVAYLILRTTGKLAGNWLAFRGVVTPAVPGRMGLGLLSHGGLAIAVVVNLQQIHDGSSPVVDAVTTIVLVGVVVSELFSPSLAWRLLGGARPSPLS